MKGSRNIPSRMTVNTLHGYGVKERDKLENKNEYIVDKYGRNGNLINIGEYYLFQPIELNYKYISIYEREVPINFKHRDVNFKVNTNIINQTIDKYQFEELNNTEQNNQIEIFINNGKNIFENIYTKYITIENIIINKIDPSNNLYVLF